jgi:hypothetical protein
VCFVTGKLIVDNHGTPMKSSKSNDKISIATKIFFEASSLRLISPASLLTCIMHLAKKAGYYAALGNLGDCGFVFALDCLGASLW